MKAAAWRWASHQPARAAAADSAPPLPPGTCVSSYAQDNGKARLNTPLFISVAVCSHFREIGRHVFAIILIAQPGAKLGGAAR